MLECVANVSEGRDMSVLRTLADACGPALLDVHVDADHNRSVFTLAGPGPRGACTAVRNLAAAVAAHVSLVGHSGEHPRFGALDVVPFVSLAGTAAEKATATREARSFAQWWWGEHGVPVFFYDDADAKGRDLPHARRHAFTRRPPDVGGDAPHPALGATAVGARLPLVAINCMLVANEVDVARRIARQVRESDGGLPGVRALGFALPEQGRTQVSMNLVDLPRTGVQDAVLQVRTLARQMRTDVATVELVGLIPRRELDKCSPDFLAWAGLDASIAIEARVGRGPRWLPGDAAPDA